MPAGFHSNHLIGTILHLRHQVNAINCLGGPIELTNMRVVNPFSQNVHKFLIESSNKSMETSSTIKKGLFYLKDNKTGG